MAIYLLSPSAHQEVNHLPMLGFKIVANGIQVRGIEHFLFTSKQAVKMAEVIAPQWKELPTLVIGEQTAKMVKQLGGEVAYVASSAYGEVFAKEVAQKFGTKQLCYLRPKVVSSDLKAHFLESGIEITEQIIYETTCKKQGANKKPPIGATIIFTSPSTIQCFLKQFTWDASYSAIAIGEHTAQHFPKEFTYDIAEVPSIEACIMKAKAIQKRELQEK